MPTSESHKKANRRWDQKNLLTVGVRLRKDEALAFKQYAADQGRAANSVLKEYVYHCIGKEFPTPKTTAVQTQTDISAQPYGTPSQQGEVSGL